MDEKEILQKMKERLESGINKIVLMTKFTPVPYAEKLLEDYKFLYDKQKRFWRYIPEEGIWAEDSELFIRSLLRKQLMGEEQQKKQYVEEVVDYIKGVCWTEKNTIEVPPNIIAFKNCLYNIDKEEYMDFSPEFFITSKIPVEITSLYQDCDKIDQFLEDLVGKEKKQQLYELMAYCLYRRYPYQKMFILHGLGNNGKSAFLRLLIHFLGKDNVSSVKPQELTKDKFIASNLYKKLANISPDIPYTELTNTSIIRELCGDDPITCQEKYKSHFQFFNYAKIIFSANELPQVRDKNYAFYRRLYIILFDREITEPDPNIVEKISNKEQLSGLAWTLVKLIKKMKAENFKFSYDPDPKEMAALYEELSSSLNKFIKESCVLDRSGSIAKWEFNDAFFSYLAEKGLRIWKTGEINKGMQERFTEGRMNQELYSKETGRFETKFVHCWDGIKFKREEKKNN